MNSNKNIVYYFIASLLFIVLKYAYTISKTQTLDFLLKPTKQIIELLTGTQSTYLEKGGYFFKQLNIVIDKSCSGFNFWILCFLMLSFLSLKFYEKHIHKIMVLSLSLIGAYLFTILVNTSRIYTSILIQNQDYSARNINPNIAHETIGIFNNLSFLIIIYLIVERILNTRNNHAKFA